MNRLCDEKEILFLLECGEHETLEAQVILHLESEAKMCAPLAAYAIELVNNKKPRKRKKRSTDLFLRNAKIACDLNIALRSKEKRLKGETPLSMVADRWSVDEKTVRNAARQHDELTGYLELMGKLESSPSEDEIVEGMLVISSMMEVRQWVYAKIGGKMLADNQDKQKGADQD